MTAPRTFLDGRVTLHHGDNRAVLKTFADASIDSICCDPPYALVSIHERFAKTVRTESTMPKAGVYARASAGFMGQQWDTGETAFAVDFWREAFRVLKPGGYLAAFSGTRTYHRLACAIEDAGFDIRDQLAWTYGSGFPKGVPLAKHIEKALGIDWFDETERERGELSHSGAYYDQFDIALKPAWEPICLARKPFSVSIAVNALAHRTGFLNIDACRIHADDAQGGDYVVKRLKPGATLERTGGNWRPDEDGDEYRGKTKPGRWPANILHDGSDEVIALFPDSDGGGSISNRSLPKTAGIFGAMAGEGERWAGYDDSGSAARFFYSAKADADDRIGSKHPTVKPVDLMQWLTRLITPPGGVTLDPFAGSGTTGEAAWREGFSAVLIEREDAFCADIARRMEHALAGPATRKATIAKLRPGRGGDLPLFGSDEAPGGQTDLRRVRRSIGPIGLRR